MTKSGIHFFVNSSLDLYADFERVPQTIHLDENLLDIC